MSLRVPYLIDSGLVTLYTPEFIARTFPRESEQGIYENLQALFEISESLGHHPRMGTVLGERAERVRALATQLDDLEARIEEIQEEQAELDFYGVEEADAINEVLSDCSQVRVQIVRLILA